MDSNDTKMHKGMDRGSMMGDDNMMMQRGTGYGMHAMGMMGGSAMVATEDGGIVIMWGSKLMKYDKDLNLIKEAEIKIDWESMNKTMMQHHKMMMATSSVTENK